MYDFLLAGVFLWISAFTGNAGDGCCPTATGPQEQTVQQSGLHVPPGEPFEHLAQRREPDEFSQGITAMIGSEAYANKMKEFVAVAASGDTSALMGLMSGEAHRVLGPAKMKEMLESGAIPFFVEYESLHNVVTISRAIGPTGPMGYWFYTYIRTVTGEVKPFSIVVVNENGRLLVMDVIVNRCRPDRHPFCP